MQQKPFPVIGSVAAMAALFGVAWLSLKVAKLDPPHRKLPAVQHQGELEQVDPGSSSMGMPRGEESAPGATRETLQLGMSSREVQLTPSAASLALAAEVVRRDFEHTSAQADLPDERGEVDAKFLAQAELEEIEESLELAELEQALAGAERTAVMHSKLQAALAGR